MRDTHLTNIAGTFLGNELNNIKKGLYKDLMLTMISTSLALYACVCIQHCVCDWTCPCVSVFRNHPVSPSSPYIPKPFSLYQIHLLNGKMLGAGRHPTGPEWGK